MLQRLWTLLCFFEAYSSVVLFLVCSFVCFSKQLAWLGSKCKPCLLGSSSNCGSVFVFLVKLLWVVQIRLFYLSSRDLIRVSTENLRSLLSGTVSSLILPSLFYWNFMCNTMVNNKQKYNSHSNIKAMKDVE